MGSIFANLSVNSLGRNGGNLAEVLLIDSTPRSMICRPGDRSMICRPGDEHSASMSGAAGGQCPGSCSPAFAATDDAAQIHVNYQAAAPALLAVHPRTDAYGSDARLVKRSLLPSEAPPRPCQCTSPFFVTTLRLVCAGP